MFEILIPKNNEFSLILFSLGVVCDLNLDSSDFITVFYWPSDVIYHSEGWMVGYRQSEDGDAFWKETHSWRAVWHVDNNTR